MQLWLDIYTSQIPLGFVKGLSEGLSFISSAWHDREVIDMAYAFE
jgi:Asp-tRNA(Asn)/Glu-tRNA(Gln) amidotransferase A subunit family amidase